MHARFKILFAQNRFPKSLAAGLFGAMLGFSFLAVSPLLADEDGAGRERHFQSPRKTNSQIQAVAPVQGEPKATSSDWRDTRLPPVLPGESVERGGKRHKVITTVGPVPVAPVPTAPHAPVAPTVPSPSVSNGGLSSLDTTTPSVSVILDRRGGAAKELDNADE